MPTSRWGRSGNLYNSLFYGVFQTYHLIMMGDDRAVAATYVAGRQMGGGTGDRPALHPGT